MFNDVYDCLVSMGEAKVLVFISYRVKTEAPLARLVFVAINNYTTPAGHRVVAYLDAEHLVDGEEWEVDFSTALVNPLVFFPLLSAGATAGKHLGSCMRVCLRSECPPQLPLKPECPRPRRPSPDQHPGR